MRSARDCIGEKVLRNRESCLGEAPPVKPALTCMQSLNKRSDKYETDPFEERLMKTSGIAGVKQQNDQISEQHRGRRG